jgi:hypothetical protein
MVSQLAPLYIGVRQGSTVNSHEKEHESLLETIFNETLFGVINSASEAASVFYPLGQTIIEEVGSRVHWIDMHKLSAVYEKIEKPLEFTHLMNVVGVFYACHEIKKSVRQLIHKRADKKFDAALKAIVSVGELFESASLVALGLQAFDVSYKVSFISDKLWIQAHLIVTISQPILEQVGIALSSVNLIIDVRNFYKTHQFLKEFEKESGINSSGKMSKEDYSKFRLYIENSNQNILGKMLVTDGTKLHERLHKLTNSEQPQREDLENVEIVLKELKGALESNLKICAFSFGINLMSIAANTLLYSGVATPIGMGLMGVSITLMITRVAVEKIHSYQFEDHIGLFERSDSASYSLKAREYPTGKWNQTKDFVKWNFGYYVKAEA